MKNALLAATLSLTVCAPAFSDVGSCRKPVQIQVPENVEQLSLPEFKGLHAQGEAYMNDARSYLKCLDGIIYSTVPEDPIVNKAGNAHKDYAMEWGAIWGNLNMACVNWEVTNATQFPGGCQPTNPTSAG